MLNMNENHTNSLIRNSDTICFTDERKKVVSILAKVFSALDPEHILRKNAEDVVTSLRSGTRLFVIGFGKASLKMYAGVRPFTKDIAAYSGIIIPIGEDVVREYPELMLLRGNHPIPGNDTAASSRTLLDSIGTPDPDDVFIVLISGGGSALFEVPRKGITVEEIGEMAKCLMSSGADIGELNRVRHMMSEVKGGKLSKMLHPAEIHAFLISDVPGDDPQLIASGPLTRPNYDKSEVEEIVRKYSGTCPRIDEIYRQYPLEIPEAESFTEVHQEIILKNYDFVQEITRLLEASGEDAVSLQDPVAGDVQRVSMRLVETVRKLYADRRKPVWLVCGGETTATVHGSGIGGRNCELSLRVALRMEKDEEYLFASIGTDGIDGVSPAMGGITDTWFRNEVNDREINESLSSSDSYNLLNMYKSAIITGYTGTNVSDVFIIYYNGIGGGRTT